MAGADVDIHLTNSRPSVTPRSPSSQLQMNNLLAAGDKAGVGHFIILSTVGRTKYPDLPYYRAKTLQENILKARHI